MKARLILPCKNTTKRNVFEEIILQRSSYQCDQLFWVKSNPILSQKAQKVPIKVDAVGHSSHNVVKSKDLIESSKG